MNRLRLWSLLLSFVIGGIACDQIGHEPKVEGEEKKFFDYKAQERVFQIIREDGGRYDHKVDWHIDNLHLMDKRGIYGVEEAVKRVDTLENGDMRISVDWVTCIVPRHKSFIRVILKENSADTTRVAFLHTYAESKGGRPRLYIYQSPKGQ